MTRYLISFDDGAMDHIPGDDWADVGKAAHTVVQEAVAAGRCAQEVRELMPDPEQGAKVRRAAGRVRRPGDL